MPSITSINELRNRMSDRRVVVTGVGTINALGTNIQDFWSNCLAGNTKVTPIPEQWQRYANFNSRYWSPLPEIDYKDFGITGNEIRQSDPASLLSTIAAREALANSLVDTEIIDGKLNTQTLKGIDPRRGGVFIGTGQGGLNSALVNDSFQILSHPKEQLSSLLGDLDGEFGEPLAEILSHMRHPIRANYFTVGMSMPNSSAANLGIKYGLKGANETIAAACASGTIAIGKAYRAIRDGSVDFAISGGTEYLYDAYGGIFRAFDLPKALTTSTEPPDTVNRPFDRDRSGFLFSEGGAGMLILEELDHALGRKAPVIAELAGYEESFDAYSIMTPEPEGREIRSLISKILSRAGVHPEQVDYINAHGTGTLKNDPVEAEVLSDIFGKSPVINSTKSLLGHTIGASGAIEAIVTALSVDNNIVHVSRNLENPILDLNFATETRELQIEKALTLSYAFGGHNGGLFSPNIRLRLQRFSVDAIPPVWPRAPAFERISQPDVFLKDEGKFCFFITEFPAASKGFTGEQSVNPSIFVFILDSQSYESKRLDIFLSKYKFEYAKRKKPPIHFHQDFI